MHRPRRSARLHSAWGSDVGWNFRHSPVAIVSAIVLVLCLGGALFAPWVAPTQSVRSRTLNLLDAVPAGGHVRREGRLLARHRRPGSRRAVGDHVRDAFRCWSASRRWVWRWCSACRSVVAGYAGGKLDAFIMRVADVQLSFPAS
jgi:peptide/nickel transport system permease protein